MLFRQKAGMICCRMDSGAEPTKLAPSPERIFQALSAYQLSNCLRGAVELDLFTAVGEGSDTPPAIARRIGASERGTRILCDYLTVSGFLEKQKGRYRLAPDSAMFLEL